MIWIFTYFIFAFFTLKDFLFVNFFTFLEGASMFMCTITPLTYCVVLFFIFNFLGRKEFLLYSFMFSLTLVFVSLSFLCSSSFYFIVFLEICVYPMSILILSFSKDSDKYISVIFMFTINILGSVPFMFYVYKSLDYLNSYSIISWSSSFNIGSSDFSIYLCFLLVLVSKLPLVFFHFWLTKAHVSASGSCSMILASLMLKLGSFGLYKFSLLFLLCSLTLMNLFLGLSLFGCLFFCSIMMRFFDLKYLIACSSILHMSLIFPLVSSLSSSGLIGSLFMMTGHGLVSYYLFFLVTLMYEFTYNRSVDFNKSLESLSKTFMLIFFIFVFMNLGFPPFVNFYSEMFFCSFLYLYSYSSVLIFCSTMLLSVIFTMFLIMKSAFGKKNYYCCGYKDQVYNIFTTGFMISIFFLPFLI